MLIVEKVCKFLTLVIPTYIINMIYSALKLNNVFIVPKLKKNSYLYRQLTIDGSCIYF